MFAVRNNWDFRAFIQQQISEYFFVAVSRLAVRETSELLGITKDELQLETCSVNLKDVLR